MTPLTPSLLAEINRVQEMDAKQLLRSYSRFFTGAVIHCAATLRQEVIYRLQEEFYNLRLSQEVVTRLNASLEKRESQAKEREAVMPGVQFVRQWHGQTHTLIYRGPKQYEYGGRIYKSPSQVAKQITNTNWNGREFFRMPALRRDTND